MGIRGLTTFIAKNPRKYFEYYELHDTYLVIDGNNIGSQLYKWHCTRNDCFGGDYDKYAVVVYNFFKLLADCNITPLIIFDGGYENKKLKTVFGRMRNKIKYAKTLNSITQASGTLFPLFLRDLFTDIALKLNLKVVRCEFEADYEMACLAQNLNCPVLSYDSDFYIFDVMYIPFSSFEMNVHKVKRSSPPKYCIGCSLYKIDNFLKLYGNLKKENVPLLATLLGNDYIKRSVFRTFYNHIKLPKNKNVKSDQQKRIISVMKWLQNETYESAVTKILGRLKSKHRKRVAQQIQLVSEGYCCRTSKLISYLDIPVAMINEKENIHTNLDGLADKLLQEIDSETVDEEDSSTTSSDDSDTGSEASELAEELLEEEEVIAEADEEKVSVQPDHEKLSVNPKRSFEQYKLNKLPVWFLEKYRKCEYPAQFMDILIRGTYFCQPQVEDYSNTCSHHISATILSACNKILSSGAFDFLRYVARSEHGGIQNYTSPPYSKDVPTLAQLQDISRENSKKVLLEVLEFDAKDLVFIETLPETWKLYCLCTIYWIKNAKPAVAYCHVYTVILCMLSLTKIDLEIGYYRSSAKFFKKFENVIKNLTQAKSTTAEESFHSSFRNITYEECLLCMKQLIPYFQMDQKMTSHLKLFDIHVVDRFAQFQSCLLHVKYLNLLLSKPYSDFIIADFFDGTFLFNMSVNLMKRIDLDAYLDLLLKDSPNILSSLKAFVKELTKILTKDAIDVTCGKKKRRKKKNRTIKDDTLNINDCLSEKESAGEENFDVNNRFCLLKLAE